jgi:hypothetical protein
VKLSAELRDLDRTVVDLVAHLDFALTPPKNERHQRAVRSGWDRDAAHVRRLGPA